MVRDNHQLHTLVTYKIKRLRETKKLTEIANKCDIPVDRLSKYIYRRKPNLTQFQLIKLCDYLGIEVSLNVEIVK